MCRDDDDDEAQKETLDLVGKTNDIVPKLKAKRNTTRLKYFKDFVIPKWKKACKK